MKFISMKLFLARCAVFGSFGLFAVFAWTAQANVKCEDIKVQGVYEFMNPDTGINQLVMVKLITKGANILADRYRVSVIEPLQRGQSAPAVLSVNNVTYREVRAGIFDDEHGKPYENIQLAGLLNGTCSINWISAKDSIQTMVVEQSPTGNLGLGGSLPEEKFVLLQVNKRLSL